MLLISRCRGSKLAPERLREDCQGERGRRGANLPLLQRRSGGSIPRDFFGGLGGGRSGVCRFVENQGVLGDSESNWVKDDQEIWEWENTSKIRPKVGKITERIQETLNEPNWGGGRLDMPTCGQAFSWTKKTHR